MTYRLAWATDLHLDHTTTKPRIFDAFCKSVVDAKADALVITGDIAEAHDFAAWLRKIKAAIDIQLFFVLGNHDRWGSSFEKADAEAWELTASSQDKTSIDWLTMYQPVRLTDTVALVGHDGWYDCNGLAAPVRTLMNDWTQIEEFRTPALPPGGWAMPRIDIAHICRTSFAIAKKAGKELQDNCVEAFKAGYGTVVVATHVPPFPETSFLTYSLKKRAPSPPETLPLYSSEAIGCRLRAVAEAWPDREMIVLSGHAHCQVTMQVAPNISARVGFGQYGNARLSDVLEFS